jgi:Rieske Fe-S protein
MVAGPHASTIKMYQAVRVSGTAYWVCRDEQGLFALENRCTHSGCTTALNTESRHWICPCHGSTFTFAGGVVKGPAVASLPRYAVCKGADGGTLIDTRRRL